MAPVEQLPSPGRVVHFDPGHGAHLPATVSNVNPDGTVNLGNILREDGTTLDPVQNVPKLVGEARFGARTGTPAWHWPEYVGPAAAGPEPESDSVHPVVEPDNGEHVDIRD